MTAVAVTVCAVAKLAVVNVNVVGAKVHCPDGSGATVTVVLALGCGAKDKVNAAVLPPSVAELSVTTTLMAAGVIEYCSR